MDEPTEMTHFELFLKNQQKCLFNVQPFWQEIIFNPLVKLLISNFGLQQESLSLKIDQAFCKNNHSNIHQQSDLANNQAH